VERIAGIRDEHVETAKALERIACDVSRAVDLIVASLEDAGRLLIARR